ncbi:MAG: branched chain amino acid aminotransferase [Deltaproteobacteria bacterium RIFCSPLOWO2_12_FULL_40_28]|nr:MAG: branched chain amino acid aminotransferase [Deltaproteobacteria bacterium RIFCSPHIGHO2_02_FULL_40_28]OGQ18946.1 MAG: branched chain amino acid aminotransferase [Deltaproteobacteria bacterium RIFCSPHIGHO2_12_FULL_40_32]OGQ39489.1 MAG: branched chain amino acid aminotransferase [Deltaproteobacteria bacterium RIFCSPLOWO2_02_FULL_40_36]OGQ53379.1 MAG: branched chain amino acid aminotransferase [Deltaproteobacteria bacterium RIFCSPLOWO2_12_FULL_40_28]
MQKVPYIWMDGKLIKWDEANVHILTHTLHYGLGVFEGIRCYECVDGKSAIFRLNDHIQRLFDSAHINLIKIPYSKIQLMDATKEVIRANKLKSAYIRPIAFMGDGEMGLHATTNPIRVAIAAWPWGTYLGEDGVKNGIRAKISSFTRPTVNSIMNKSKTCGNYINSIWAKREALASGYEEAIMLDNEGYISEATGENFFMVKNGVVHTPALGNSILDGITRATLLTYLKDQKIQTIEERITRDQAYLADEVFVCGTAAEITPIREIDDRTIGTGKPGPLTKKIQEFYFGVIRGKHSKYAEWLAFI